MESRCLLCGRPARTGLNLMGCFLCLNCETRLLRPDAARRLSRRRRLRLMRLYDRCPSAFYPL